MTEKTASDMKKLLFLVLMTLSAAAVSAQVRFESRSTDAVRAMAAERNKLVFIDLFATWCPPCRMMEREVFSREDVGEFMAERFVCAQYDVDKSTGRALMRKYGVRSVPTYMIFDIEGELLGSITGGSSAGEFMKSVERILAGSGKGTERE